MSETEAVPSARATALADQWLKINAPFQRSGVVLDGLARLLEAYAAESLAAMRPPAPDLPSPHEAGGNIRR